MTSSWQDVYDRAACPTCKAPPGVPCRRMEGQVGAPAATPHQPRRRVAAGLPTFSGDTARAAGWAPLDEVLAVLHGMATDYRTEDITAWTGDVLMEVAQRLAERFGPTEANR